jgi:cell division protease FtsH
MHETQQPRDPKKTTGIVYAVILVVLLLLNFWAFPAMMKGQVKQVDYGTFLNMLEGGELSTVEIQDQQIYFVDKNDTTYCTNSIAQDLQLVNRLESAGVSFGKVYNQTTWVDTLLGWVISLLPMIILIVWFNRMMRKRVGEMTGGANSMIFGGGKSGAKQYVVEDGKSIKFADVAGEDEAKESLQEIVDFLHNPKRYEDIGAKMPKGVLLVAGPRCCRRSRCSLLLHCGF